MKERYRDLEHLLFVGFIPLKLKIGGVNFVFKSVNDLEYDQVQLMSGIKDDPLYYLNFHLNYLFYSIYMVNGVNFLKCRQDIYSEVVDTFRHYPHALIKTIFNNLEDITKRAEQCSRLVEPYTYEAVSRYNWATAKDTRLNSTSQTSIYGTETLGLNYFQKYWVVLNRREDTRESFEQQYSLFKFLASFTDSKAVKRIDAVDKKRKEEDDSRRERIRTIGTEEEIKYLTSPTDTRDGIIAELEKQMRGEKDEHDRIIEEHERQLREDMLRQMQELKRLKDERNKREDFVLEQARPISQEEMVERMQKARESQSRISPIDYVDNETKKKFLQMSNVTDEDIIKSEKVMSEKDYTKMMDDELFSGLKDVPERAAEEVERDYQMQQKKLAYKYGYDDEDGDIGSKLDFPNLRNR